MRHQKKKKFAATAIATVKSWVAECDTWAAALASLFPNQESKALLRDKVGRRFCSHPFFSPHDAPRLEARASHTGSRRPVELA